MTSTKFTHAIVHFPVDNTVEVVPKSWLLPGEEMCYFPNHTSSSIRKQIKKAEIHSAEWPQFVCKVYKSYESYSDARSYLEEATFTSDLSEIEGCTRRTKKTKKPDHVLPIHPAEGPQSTVQENQMEANSGHSQVEPPRQPPEIQPRGQEELPSHVAAPPSGPSLVLAGGDDRASIPSQNAGQGAVESTPGSTVGEGASVSTPALNTGEGQTNTFQLVFGESMEEFQKDVLLSLKSITDTLKDHTETLNSILTNMGAKDTGPVEKYCFSPAYFPIKSLDSAGGLQILVTENLAARHELVRVMSSCGGGTVEDAVKLILRMLMTDDLLAEHCCKGRSSKKKRFLEYNTVVGAILSSLQNNVRTKSSATMESLEQAISKGLKQAVDRISQRKLQEARSRPDTQSSNPT